MIFSTKGEMYLRRSLCCKKEEGLADGAKEFDSKTF